MLRLIMLFLAIIFLRFGLMAQCDPSVVPSVDEKLAYRSRGNRCEGFFVAKVASYKIRLVSFTLGDVSFAMEESEVIEVHAPEPNLRLQAFGIPNDLYYRMDVELLGNKLKWPVGEVLYQDERTRLARNIGIIAFKQEDNDKIYYPVRIQGQKTNASTQTLVPLLKIISPTRLSRVEWKIDKEEKYRALTGASFRANTPIYIRIPENINGTQNIVIHVKDENSGNSVFLKLKVKI